MHYLYLDSIHNKCDIFGVGAAVSGAFNIGAQALTNEANKQMTEQTNATNLKIAQDTNEKNLQIARETNALQVAESEKAYQRSTASNQIAELVKTGISEQQARQIVAGSGSPATYTPGAMQSAQMVAPTMQAPQFDAAAMGNAAGQLGSGLSGVASGIFDSFNDPKGGVVGLLSSLPAIQSFSGLSSLFKPEGLSNWNSLFEMVLNGDENDSRWNKIPSQNELAELRDIVYKVQKKGVPAIRAFMNGVQQYSDMNGVQFRLANQRWQAKSAAAQSRLDEVQASIAEKSEDDLVRYNQYVADVLAPQAAESRALADYLQNNPQVLNKYVVDEFTQLVRHAAANAEVWNDKDYFENFVETLKGNQKHMYLAVQAMLAKDAVAKNLYGTEEARNPWQQTFATLGYILSDMGVQQAIMDFAALAIKAKGIPGK